MICWCVVGSILQRSIGLGMLGFGGIPSPGPFVLALIYSLVIVHFCSAFELLVPGSIALQLREE